MKCNCVLLKGALVNIAFRTTSILGYDYALHDVKTEQDCFFEVEEWVFTDRYSLWSIPVYSNDRVFIGINQFQKKYLQRI